MAGRRALVNPAAYLYLALVLFSSSATRCEAFLAGSPQFSLGGRGSNRLSATLVREQGGVPGGLRPDQQQQGGFGGVGGPQLTRRQEIDIGDWQQQTGTSMGQMGGPQLTGRQEVDVENWFWGQQPDRGLQNMLFADDNRAVVLFDGVCNFCSEAVNFCLTFECDPTKGCFRFAALQGDLGQSLLRSFGLDTMVFDTIVLVEPDGRHYIKSEAVLRIAARLREPFPQLARLGRLLPVEFRDEVYEWVSARRHIFGEAENCRIPGESELERFLD